MGTPSLLFPILPTITPSKNTSTRKHFKKIHHVFPHQQGQGSPQRPQGAQHQHHNHQLVHSSPRERPRQHHPQHHRQPALHHRHSRCPHWRRPQPRWRLPQPHGDLHRADPRSSRRQRPLARHCRHRTPRNDHALGRESMPTETTKTGPVHHNEKLNKLDPRVKEHQHTATTGTGFASDHRPSDPTNAAHVPPSVLKEHVGEPTVEHDYPEDSTHKRHSVSHQEQHLMK